MTAVYDDYARLVPTATSNDLVLIGGGSTASTLLIRLAEKVSKHGLPSGGLNIRSFDKNGLANGGIAYGGASEFHILNSVRTEMSPWDLYAFHDFCKAKGLGADENDFNKRRDYAEFLKIAVNGAINILREAGATFTHYPHDVYVEKNAKGQFDVYDFANDKAVLSGCTEKQIVLAAGYGPNNNFTNLKKSKHYVHSLYDESAQKIDDIKDGSEIVFVGGGPALYDFANDLKGRGITDAKLTVIARSNNKPLGVRDVSIEATEQRTTPEFVSSGLSYTAKGLDQAIQAIFNDVASKRRFSLDTLRNIGLVLKRMDPKEAENWLKLPTIERLRHSATPVPIQSDLTLKNYSPSFIQARISEKEIRQRSHDFIIDVAHGKSVRADYIINGTGHGKHNAPVFEKLKQQGLAYVSPFLGVLATEDDGYSLAISRIASIGTSTHTGCDGVESYDVHVEEFINALW